MTFKKLTGKLHLWLGLTSGLVVFVVAITGCIYAFEKEIQDFTQLYRHVEAENKAFLLPSQLKVMAEEAFISENPERKSEEAKRVYYRPEGKSAVALFYGKGGYYYSVFMNPYSGEVLKVKNMRTSFFTIILYLHFQLLLPHEIGGKIVSYATLIFVVMLISGLVLWWPKNKSASKQRFRIKWSARWRRKNYDLHNVLGFYMTWVVIFIALTGLVWGLQWFEKSVYWISSGGKSHVAFSQPQSDTTKFKENIHLTLVDKAWINAVNEADFAGESMVGFPVGKSGIIAVSTNADAGTYYKTDYRYFDQYTLEEFTVDHARGRLRDASTADMVSRLNYDIHVGSIFGLPGKLMAFFASLIAASLPVTGFIIWWGRKEKNKAKKSGKRYKSHRPFFDTQGTQQSTKKRQVAVEENIAE